MRRHLTGTVLFRTRMVDHVLGSVSEGETWHFHMSYPGVMMLDSGYRTNRKGTRGRRRDRRNGRQGSRGQG